MSKAAKFGQPPCNRPDQKARFSGAVERNPFGQSRQACDSQRGTMACVRAGGGEGDPVMALEGPRRERIVAAAFAVGDSNFPLRIGFPLFVSNVVHWLAGRRSGTEDLWKAGQTFIPAKDEKISQSPSAKQSPKGSRDNT